ncbi:farnesylcysteine lyase [Impatiens glandulifera]|uniref:farnesylcysteine lyase n=1 Tax=Impatiens glandulifera TaxID=253017 RepID=UPI001FB12049|nr:farnesylcysteine lyase [Impatiens glandulifera]
MANYLIISLFILLSSSSQTWGGKVDESSSLCIIGSGIGGSSVAHFIRRYASSSSDAIGIIRIFERHDIVGGRMATVSIAGDTFEAGASILHPKNYHAVDYVNFLNLTVKKPSSSSFGIWDGDKFIFRTLESSGFWILDQVISLVDSVQMLWRYGFSLFRMNNFIEITVNKFLKYYESCESRPVFETVDEMLKWAGLYNLTSRILQEELINARLSPALIDELVTVITKINYGQSVNISGLAGAVSLAGSGEGLWAIEGGNWQMAAGLIRSSDVTLHLSEEIESVSDFGDYYELNSTQGNSYKCEVTVVATPLDEINLLFTPKPWVLPERKLQHTHATFVRGLLDPAYFGVKAASGIPELVGTIETPDLPFTSISVLKEHTESDKTYKIFSRATLTDTLLGNLFSTRTETIRIDWAAYPQYEAPERFAPIILDGKHLYYVNAFENAASTMETSAVSAENVARLILSRKFGKTKSSLKSSTDPTTSCTNVLHSDL